MIVSLNEIETMALKATRGAGLAWGLAEDAGKAMRWLAANDLPWLAPLLGRLDRKDSLAPPRLPMTGGVIAPERHGALLCPLLAGTLLLDLASNLPMRSLRIHHIAEPLLVVPFLALVLELRGEAMSVTWDSVRIDLAGGVCTGGQRTADLIISEAALVTLAPALPAAASRAGRRTGPDVAAVDWARLDSYAARTYVPEGEVSRRRGAGAELDDND